MKPKKRRLINRLRKLYGRVARGEINIQNLKALKLIRRILEEAKRG